MSTKVSTTEINDNADKIQQDLQEAIEIIEAAYFVVRMNKFYLCTVEPDENSSLISVEMHMPKNQRNEIEKLNDDIISFLMKFRGTKE